MNKKIFIIVFVVLFLALIPIGIWQFDNVKNFVTKASSTGSQQPVEEPINISSGLSGLYDKNDKQIVSWEWLKDNGYISVDNGVLTSNYHLDEHDKRHFDMQGHLVIDKEVTSIGDEAFYYSSGRTPFEYQSLSLNKITLPDTVTSIGKFAFSSSKISNLIIPDSVIEIGLCAFKWSFIETINIPCSVKNIGASAFYNCEKLVSVTGLEGMNEIPNSCFEYCSNLRDIVIPGNITKIGEWAFSRCNALKQLTLSNISLSNYAFYSCYGLKEVIFTGEFSVSSWGQSVFESCSSLKKVVFPEGFKIVGYYSFRYCNSLEEVKLSSSIFNICPGAFTGCTKLLNIYIPWNLTRVSETANDCFQFNFMGTPFEKNTTLYFEVDDSLTCVTPDLYEYYTTYHNAQFGYTYEEYLTAIGKN